VTKRRKLWDRMEPHDSPSGHQAKADRAPRFPTMSDNRSSVVNLSRPIALAPRTRCRSRPHGARRGGLGQVNSAGRDAAEYNLERKRTSSTSSAGLPKRRAADTYPCDASWPGPSWPCMYSIHFERGPPCQKKRSRRRNRKPN
jgi:hypothetical protein